MEKTQKAKLTLRAQEMTLTTDNPDDHYLNTPTRVGFVMPSAAPSGSRWPLTLCTQHTNATKVIKSVHSVTLPGFITVEKPS